MALNPDTHAYVSIGCPKELHEAIKNLAEKNERSVSAQIVYMLKQQLKKDSK